MSAVVCSIAYQSLNGFYLELTFMLIIMQKLEVSQIAVQIGFIIHVLEVLFVYIYCVIIGYSIIYALQPCDYVWTDLSLGLIILKKYKIFKSCKLNKSS